MEEEESGDSVTSPRRKICKIGDPKKDGQSPGSGSIRGPPSYNGPPVMMNLVGQANSFKSLAKEAQRKMGEEIKKQVGQLQHISLAERGDLTISPLTTLQKSQLLEITSLFGLEVKCSLTKWEQDGKALIHGVPIDLTEDEIKAHLRDDGVVGVKRMNRWQDGKALPTESVILNFSSKQHPTRVKIDWLSYQVKTFIPPPRQCWNCWGFGHTKMICKAKTRCRKCGEGHASDIKCKNPAQCPSCLDAAQTGPRDHEAGTVKCPLFVSRRENNKTAVLQGLSFDEAKRRATQSPSALTPQRSHNDDHDLVKEMSTMKRDIEDLKKREKSEVSLANHPVIVMIQNEVVDLKADIQEVKEKMGSIEELKEEVREEVKKACADTKIELKKAGADTRDEVKKESEALYKKLEALVQSLVAKKGTYGTRTKATANTLSKSSINREVTTPVSPPSSSVKIRPSDPPRVDPRAWRKKPPLSLHDLAN